MSKLKLKALGKKVTSFSKIETFPCPAGVSRVKLISDEVSSMCPVTGQPDWYTVEIDYLPRLVCAESKTVKLFLQSFRNEGHFCENFSQIICQAFYKALQPKMIWVTVTQKPRGGVSIVSTASLPT